MSLLEMATITTLPRYPVRPARFVMTGSPSSSDPGPGATVGPDRPTDGVAGTAAGASPDRPSADQYLRERAASVP